MANVYFPANIRVDCGVTTFINVFAIAPANQQALLELLKSQTDSSIRKQPGFLNANFHSSLDGTRVVNYVQWTDQRSSEVIHENPEIMAAFAQYQVLNVKMDMRYYEVVYTAGQPTVIEPHHQLTTLISLVSVKPNQQQQVLDVLEKEVSPIINQQVGLISTSLHRSLDGTRILNYSQWNTQAIHQTSDLLSQTDLLMSVIEGASDRIETHLYKVAFTADAHGLYG